MPCLANLTLHSSGNPHGKTTRAWSSTLLHWTKQHVVICFSVRVDQIMSPLLHLARILQVLVTLILFVIGKQRLVEKLYSIQSLTYGWLPVSTQSHDLLQESFRSPCPGHDFSKLLSRLIMKRSRSNLAPPSKWYLDRPIT